MARSDRESPFLDAVGQVGPALLRALDALERAQRQLHPPQLTSVRGALAPLAAPLDTALEALREAPPPDGLEGFGERLTLAARKAREGLALFCEEGAGETPVMRILGALQRHCEAQAALYPLRRALPPVSRYFLEPALWDRADDLDPEAPEGVRTGILDAHASPEARGSFVLYVPETYDGSASWPLVVALHGGGGDGRHFLWTWLREARGRRFLLMAPTARDATWSLHGPDLDAAPLCSMVAFVRERWRVDDERVLLTGLSDGATYALLCGLGEDMPFTALAPVSGVLHPANFGNGNLARARGRRIHLVHGALDWMFPISVARMAANALEEAGADLTFREIDDLSHTYPREENAKIIEWLDPRRAAPPASAAASSSSVSSC